MNAPVKPAPGFAGVKYEDAVARALELIPALRERAPRAEEERIMLPETLADLHRTGLLRVLQPKRWGGMEFDYLAYVEFPELIARGCASTGWNVGNLLIHHWMLALYDERAQQEVWGSNPEALIASGIAYPQGSGKREKRDGASGFLVSGRWNFSSAVNVADWNMLACIVREGDKVVDHRMCLLHKSEYEVVDDWHVLGMRSTGSMTVVAKDVFVPEHRALCAYDLRGGVPFPGRQGQSESDVPRAVLGHGRARHRRRGGRQRAGGARPDGRLREKAQHQLPGPQDARHPDHPGEGRRRGRAHRRGARAAAPQLP